VIATKVFSLERHPGLSAANIRAAVDDSLGRLHTDYIDLYYAHRDDNMVAQEEYVAAFGSLVAEGKVREVGASNFSADRLRGAVDVAAQSSVAPFTVAQDQYSLVERAIEANLVGTLMELGIVELPYSSLAGGFLTGKYREGGSVDSARAGSAGAYLNISRHVELLGTLDDIASAHGVSVAAVSLAWLRQQEAVGAPIASARTVGQVAPLVESFGLVLTDEQLGRLA
jgi:aryl-alcohol dehydrogenase-like predicted oxidoreductase